VDRGGKGARLKDVKIGGIGRLTDREANNTNALVGILKLISIWLFR